MWGVFSNANDIDLFLMMFPAQAQYENGTISYVCRTARQAFCINISPFTVSSKWVLQQEGEFRIPVRNVLFFVG